MKIDKKLLQMKVEDLKKRHEILMSKIRYHNIPMSFSGFDLVEQPQEKPTQSTIAKDIENIRADLGIEKGSWSADEPLWKVLMETDTYQAIKLFPRICATKYAIGTCTAARGFAAWDLPPVKRGDKGVIVDPRSLDLLDKYWIDKIKKLDTNCIMIIFNEHLYFIDPKELNKIKYTHQPNLF